MVTAVSVQESLFSSGEQIDVEGDSSPVQSKKSSKEKLEVSEYNEKEFQLAKFVVDRATRSAIDTVITCAVDGCDKWKIFFDAGLVDAISEDSEFESEFFSKLCSKGLPYTAEILDGYMNRLPANRRKKLMDGTNIKRKFHPAALCFTGASFPTKSGEYFLKALEVLVNHGMNSERVEYIASKSFADMERAFSQELDPFVDFLFRNTKKLPDDLAINISSRSPLSEKIIAYLVIKKKIDLKIFMTQEVKLAAKPNVIDFVSALQGRFTRQSENIVISEEEAL